MFEYYDGRTISGGYMGGNPIENFVANNYALNDIILPFVAFASLMYIALIVIPWERKPKMIISTSFSLLIVVTHVMNAFPYGWDPVVLLSRGLLMFGIIAFIFALLLIIIGVFGFEPGKVMEGSWAAVFGLMFLAFVFIFYNDIFPFLIVLAFIGGLGALLAPGNTVIPYIFVVLMAMIFVIRFAFGFPYMIPYWMQFLMNEAFQAVVIVGYLIVTGIRVMTHEDAE